MDKNNADINASLVRTMLKYYSHDVIYSQFEEYYVNKANRLKTKMRYYTAIVRNLELDTTSANYNFDESRKKYSHQEETKHGVCEEELKNYISSLGFNSFPQYVVKPNDRIIKDPVNFLVGKYEDADCYADCNNRKCIFCNAHLDKSNYVNCKQEPFNHNHDVCDDYSDLCPGKLYKFKGFSDEDLIKNFYPDNYQVILLQCQIEAALFVKSFYNPSFHLKSNIKYLIELGCCVAKYIKRKIDEQLSLSRVTSLNFVRHHRFMAYGSINIHKIYWQLVLISFPYEIKHYIPILIANHRKDVLDYLRDQGCFNYVMDFEGSTLFDKLSKMKSISMTDVDIVMRYYPRTKVLESLKKSITTTEKNFSNVFKLCSVLFTELKNSYG